ncbi:MAG: substrate-binding domain-containing protein [Acidimicrobiales bacterium]
MKLMRKMVVGLSLTATLIGVSGVAAGATAPTDSGWDDKVDTIVGQGSDTTYRVMGDLSLTYNAANGCVVATADTGTAPNFTAPLSGDCVVTGQTSTFTKGNWDHDLVVNKYPVGSSQGVKELLRGSVDFARSSRPPKTSGETGSTFWGYAKDGIAIVVMGGRTPFNITQAQAVGIWNCTITDWNQLDNTLPSAPIYPYGMNPSSGTKASMDSFLGFDANSGACVKKLSTNAYPFENDVKQLIDTPAPGTTLANSIWWGSYAELKTYAYKRQSADYMAIGGVEISNGSIADNSYPIKRFVYHVTKSADVAPNGTGGTTGATTGKPGAVRAFTEWMCKPKSQHITSDYTNASLYDINTATITNNGFQRIPTIERTNGGVCNITVAP